MNYALEFDEQGLHDLQALESWLQEEALDELEIVASDPLKYVRAYLSTIVHDFVRIRDHSRFYVFVTVAIDTEAQVVRTLNIGLFVRSTPVT